LLILFDKFLDPIKFTPVEATTLLEPNWAKPEFGFEPSMLNMNMRRFFDVIGIKKEPVGARYHDGWHTLRYLICVLLSMMKHDFGKVRVFIVLDE